MLLKSLYKSIRSIRRAAFETSGFNTFGEIHEELEGKQLVIVGSGNSLYPARYLEWLLNKTSSIPTRLVTPLEYSLVRPRQTHVCLLLSQGASRGDSISIEQLCRRYKVPLFIVCDSRALHEDSDVLRLALTNQLS